MPTYEAEGWVRPGCGTVDGYSPAMLREDEGSVLQNLKIMNGKLVKRGGTVIQGSAPASATVRCLILCYSTDVATALALRVALIGTAWYYKVGAGAWTSFKTGYTAGTYPVFVAYQGKVYVVDGTNTPFYFTIANPPVPTNWTTLPSGINPAWVVLHYNRLRYGGDLTTPNYYYMTDPGDPTTTTTTNFYLQPDDQNGNYPKIAIVNNNRIGLFCQDFLVSMSGAGPYTDQFYPLPRGAANVAWRSVVDMGEFGVFFLTERGVFNWDLNGSPVPIDPFGKIDWGSIDFTTEALTWAMRVGDEYRLYFKAKGDITRTSASAAAIIASSTGYTRVGGVYAARTFVSLRAFTTSTTTDSYYSYDCRLRQMTGPHTGGHLCGAWEQYRYGDTQDPWVGSAAADGKVWKADQQSAFTDDTTTAIECVYRSGAVGARRKTTRVTRITTEFGVVDAPAESGVEVSLWQNGMQDGFAYCAVYSVGISRRPEDGGDILDMEDFVVNETIPQYKGGVGKQPQLQIRYAGQSPFELRSYALDYESEV